MSAARDLSGPPPPYWLYVLECSDGSYYCGIAKDVKARFKVHCAGKGGRYTRAHRPLKVLALRPYASKGDALRAEIAVKRLPKAKKLGFFAAVPDHQESSKTTA